jgi:hypothetical protein
MANVFPKQVKKEIVDSWLPAAEATWKVALLDNGFVYDHTTDDLYTDVTGDELPNGNGYTTAGATLAGRTGGYVNTYDYYLDATNTAWTSATFVNVRYVVVYEDSTKKIRFIFDLGANYSCTNSTFTVVWSTTPLGLITLTS